MQIVCDPEFESLIPPPNADELASLEASIAENGVLDPIRVWDGHGIVLDGHNRKRIADRLGREYRTAGVVLEDRDDCKVWIIQHQFARRNISAMQRAELALKLKPLLAEKGHKNRVLGGKNEACQKSDKPKVDPVDTKKELASAAGVSHDTIAKVEKIVNSPVVELARMTRGGKVSINAAAKVAEMPVEEQRKVVESGPEAVKAAAKLADKPASPDPEPWSAYNEQINDAVRAVTDGIGILIALRESNNDFAGWINAKQYRKFLSETCGTMKSHRVARWATTEEANRTGGKAFLYEHEAAKKKGRK